MRRTAFLLCVLVASIGVAAAGCGQEQEQTASPETVQGEVTTTETETTETETTETDTTETDTTETETETETTETETTETGGGTPQGDPVAGKEVFLGASGCAGCHTLADAGSTGTVGPNLDDSKPSFDLAYDRVTNGQGGMPSFATSLTDQQRADVSAYVSSVAGQ
jgi:mono/diheme cytochrome c family protein